MRGGVQTEEARVGAGSGTDDNRGAPLGLDDEMFALRKFFPSKKSWRCHTWPLGVLRGPTSTL